MIMIIILYYLSNNFKYIHRFYLSVMCFSFIRSKSLHSRHQFLCHFHIRSRVVITSVIIRVVITSVIIRVVITSVIIRVVIASIIIGVVITPIIIRVYIIGVVIASLKVRPIVGRIIVRATTATPALTVKCSESRMVQTHAIVISSSVLFSSTGLTFFIRTIITVLVSIADP